MCVWCVYYIVVKPVILTLCGPFIQFPQGETDFYKNLWLKSENFKFQKSHILFDYL